MMRKPTFRATVVAATLAATQSDVPAQEINTVFDEPSVFDLVLGDHALELETDKFAEFACGTNGGPPGLPLSGFSEYAKCRPEGSGLHDIYFRYDDEAEYIARARNLEYQVSLFGGTTVYAIAVIVSGLFDDHGILQGIRIVSDPKAPESEREAAYTLGRFLKARYHLGDSDCEDRPPLEGETPVGGIFIKESCTTTLATGEGLHLETNHYRRPGEMALDRAGIAVTHGQFWSEIRLEVVRAPDPVADEATLARAASLPDPAASIDPVAARARDCPGCDLAGANLKRADLSNADLRGANLEGANLHAAILSGANLAGTNLAGANLNKADLRTATLADADLTGAMAYEGRFEGANLVRANVSGGFLGHAQFIRADLSDSNFFYADMRGARFTDAFIAQSNMTQTWLEDAIFLRANLTGVVLDGAILINAEMRRATLVDASLVDADLYRANLSEADLTNADLRKARLTNTNFRDANMSGAIRD